jgi:hypothetical protein
MPMKSMAGLLYAGSTRGFKEQGIMPQRGGQPLHPIQLCKFEIETAEKHKLETGVCCDERLDAGTIARRSAVTVTPRGAPSTSYEKGLV